MTRVRFDHITKRFGDTVALDDVNLEIAAGELFFLLGPLFPVIMAVATLVSAVAFGSKPGRCDHQTCARACSIDERQQLHAAA